MNTTLNDIITETLKGKSVVVYEYDALFIYQNKRRISNWFLNDTDKNKKHYQSEKYWRDLQVRKHIGTIVSVSGNYIPYEGTSINMILSVNGVDIDLDINMEDNLELMDLISTDEIKGS